MKAFFTRQSSSFTYLNTTQFLGALNDNLFKLLIAYFCIDLIGEEHSTKILATAGAVFVIPFLLFSSTSGMLADRFSKRNIIVVCKAIEVIVMSLGVLVLWLQSIHGAYTILFLMATQSALFGPSKYGIIPELVKIERISQANGLITMMTFLAIIIGTFLASFITDVTYRNYIVVGTVCSLIAIAGLAASLCIEETPPSGSQKKIHPWFLLEIYKTTKAIKQQPTLLIAVLGSAYFLFAGAFIQLNIIPFAIQSLHLTDVQGGYLFLLAAVGIGTGSMLAGKLSGKVVELGLVPIGGLGMVAGCFLLDAWSDQLFLIIPLVIVVGIFGGIYVIPLDAYIQVASPKEQRGQVVATTNFFAFLGVLGASATLYTISEVIGLKADKGFTFLGYLTLLMTGGVTALVYHYLTRYLGMLMARLHFKIAVHGQENVSFEKPSIFVCHHTAWNDTLIMLGAQSIPMRFFMEHLQEHSSLLKRLYQLLKVTVIPSIELVEESPKDVKLIQKTLKKGISVCIFLDEVSDVYDVSKIRNSFENTLQATSASLLSVTIEKGEKQPSMSKFNRLLKKIRVPARVVFAKI